MSICEFAGRQNPQKIMPLKSSAALTLPCTIEEIRSCKEIPKPIRWCGVYFLFSNKKLLYVGQSVDCILRVQDHIHTRANHIDKKFEITHATYVETSVMDLNSTEQYYIELFIPVWNSCSFTKKICRENPDRLEVKEWKAEQLDRRRRIPGFSGHTYE